MGGGKGRFFGGDSGVTCLDLCFDCVMSDVFHSFFLPSYSLKVNWSNLTRLLCILGDKTTSVKSHSQQQDISPDSSSTLNLSLTFALGNIVWESSVANSCIGKWHETGQQAYLDILKVVPPHLILVAWICVSITIGSMDRVIDALRQVDWLFIKFKSIVGWASLARFLFQSSKFGHYISVKRL